MTRWEERLRPALRGLPVAALVLGLVALVALASRAGHAGAHVPAVPGPPTAFFDYAFTVALVLVLAAAVLSLRHLKRPQPRQVRSSWQLLASILGVFAVAILAAAIARQLHVSQPAHRPGSGAEGGAQPARLPPDRPAERRIRFRWEAAVAGGAVVLLAGAALVLLRRRRPAAAEVSGEEEPLPEALGAALDESLDDLRRERDPRRAVIAAYARAEGVLARHGLPRRASEAPLEYLGRVLLELRVRASAVLELTELFERAKFSPHRIDAAMKDDAIAALAAVRDDLGAPR